MEIPDRLAAEGRFSKRMGRLTSKHRRELVKLLGNPPDVSNVSQSFWERVEREVEDETAALLLLLFMASASAHTGDRFGELQGQLTSRAAGYASRTSKKIANRYVGGAQESLRNRAREWEPTRHEPEQGEDGEQLPPKPPTPPTRGEVQSGAAKVFGPAKAEEIAISETTDSQSAGGEAAAELTGTTSDDDLWMTEEDNSVCPICQPLNRKRRPVWSARFPSGPKAHNSCRCWINYAATPGNDKDRAGSIDEAFHILGAS